MSSKILVNCKDANHYCDKSQYREASFWERVRLALHLVYCRKCQKYTARNQNLTKLMKDSNLHALDAADKMELENMLQKELSK